MKTITRTRINKLIAVGLTVMMVITLWMYMSVMKASAYPSAYPVPSLTGNQREDIVNVALSQKGYKKSGGTVYGAWYDSIKGTNFTNSAWCAMFVSWCANQSGIDQDILTYRSYVPDMVTDFKNRGQWYDRNYTPSRGDIIIVNSSGHVGIVTGVSGSTVYTIEGNKTSLGSACGTDSYTIGSSYITGYGTPNYNSAPLPNDDELDIPYPRPQISSTTWLGKNGITSGNYVKGLQTALNKANNAELDVDGQFGSGTTTAVKNFQTKHGLTQDGQAGVATINKLVDVIKSQNSVNPAIKCWISDNKMGDSVSVKETNKWYYLCYELVDKNTLQLLSQVKNKYKNYSVTEEVYNPDGSLFHSCTYKNSDNNWIGFKPGYAGAYKYKITINGDLSWSGEKEFSVSETKPNLAAPNLTVEVNGKEVTFSWNLVDNATGYDLRIYNSDGTSYADYWDFPSNENSLTITVPANTAFSAAVCSKNSNYEEYWSYCQPVYFETGKHEHEYGEWIIEKSATCTGDGMETRSCLRCDENEIRSIPAIGHDWSSWTIVKEATCTTEGEKSRKCNICKDYEGYSIPVISHLYTEKIVKPTHAENGYTLHMCSLCGNSYKDNFTEKLAKLKGDINSDDEFNVSDAVLFQKWLLSVPDVKLADWKAADLCEDDRLDVFDLCMMKRMLLNS